MSYVFVADLRAANLCAIVSSLFSERFQQATCGRCDDQCGRKLFHAVSISPSMRYKEYTLFSECKATPTPTRVDEHKKNVIASKEVSLNPRRLRRLPDLCRAASGERHPESQSSRFSPENASMAACNSSSMPSAVLPPPLDDYYH
jgi:hypothetical protein